MLVDINGRSLEGNVMTAIWVQVARITPSIILQPINDNVIRMVVAPNPLYRK